MTQTNKKTMSVKTLLDTIKNAYTIKDWGDQYRVYSDGRVVFVFMDEDKNITHFSTMILANGEMDKILVSKSDAKKIKLAISTRQLEIEKKIIQALRTPKTR